MGTLYLICALAGGAILLLQLVLLGFGVDDASAHDVSLGEGLNLFGVRSIVAAITFFGVGGLLATAVGLPWPLTLLGAAASGGAAAIVVALIMRSLVRLESDGTVRIDNAIGLPGTVYLRVPGGREGVGKVTLQLQGQTVEYQAVSATELPTGAPVVVVDVVGPDTVEVAPPHYLEGASDVS